MIKELENKLKISEKTCIHCPTEKLAKQVLNIFNKLGLKWCNGIDYTLNHNWDKHEENTLYYPFDGLYSSLKFANLTGYKAISAEEFIVLHTEGKEFKLQSYTPKGNLKGFPKEIIARMLECQEEQGNPRDISVFEKRCDAEQRSKGFTWYETKEGLYFWYDVVNNKDFNLFFEKYPKQDNPQDFRINDNVIDIITRARGKISEINTNDNILPMYVSLNEGEYFYTLDGRRFIHDKYPRLLHYRDDYDYDVIDFNNLPKSKRQEPNKRWRAEEGGEYHFLRFSLEGWFYTYATKDNNDSTDNINYNSGNYFRTEVDAEIIAQKLNTYFKQLIQEEHEHEKIQI